MSNIKKKINGKWSVLASGQATGISVVNPRLLPKNEVITSVDAVLESHADAIAKLERNVAWLALHGGGGSGGSGGGGGSDITEATATILVNEQITGSVVAIDSSGLAIRFEGITAATPKNWVFEIRVGANKVRDNVTVSFAKPTVFIPLSDIQKGLINHRGTLYIGASYDDEANGIYGAATWSGEIVENVVNLYTANSSFTFDTLSTSSVVYNYSVGITGNYILSVQVKKGDTVVNSLEYPITIPSTSNQTKAIDVSELLNITENTSQVDAVGVYNIEALLYKADDNRVQGTHTSTVTLVSDRVLISTTKMSTDQSNPTEVSLSGSINVSFTAYLQGGSTFHYTYKVGEETVKGDTIGYFGSEVNDFVPVANNSWAVEGNTVPLTLTVTSGDKSATATYYVKFTAASATFLDISNANKVHTLSEFYSRDYSNGTNTFNLRFNNYLNGGNTYSITSKLAIENDNNLSAITVLENGQPYLRLSNGAYASLKDWTFNNRKQTLPNLLTTKQFTISICFKADYHPDDDRTILFCGNADVNTGEIINGVSIDVHDVYINNESKVKLTDNVINMVDITCVETYTPNEVTGANELSYIIKIYLDGVLTSVFKTTTFLELGDIVYLGGRIYRGLDGNQKADYLCDCNIYNLQIYDSALTDLDIVTNYINNKVSTTYFNGNPNFGIIDEELRTNFCEREGSSVKSKLYTDSGYTIDFLLSNNRLDIDNLNNYAAILGIPIMLIDVDPHWTFNDFITQQTAGSISIGAANGVPIQYWDPRGTNSAIVNISNVNIKLQGTSTLSNAVKNIDITVPSSTVFIPKETWLPEQTYTLKADVSDSSHSNNASIGKFINEVLGYNEEDGSSYLPFDRTAISNVYNSDYKKNQQPTATLKHTVEGFPVFLIMKFKTDTVSTVSTTPLGVYSFNLGRAAYRNLGFKKLNSIIDNTTGEKPSISTFPYALENAIFSDTDSNATWIEIDDTHPIADMENVTTSFPENFNSSNGDFWQKDPNILDLQYKVRYPVDSSKGVSDYSNFVTFVENIMKLPIEGTYETYASGVESSEISSGYDLYTVNEQNVFSKTGERQTMITSNEINSLPADLGFNDDSVYKYFTIAMLFGLVDNFGKNSTYRSWNDGPYYVDFYDMDTALGGGNQGQLDIYPDTWLKYLTNRIEGNNRYGYVVETFNERLKQSRTVPSANHSKLWLSLDTLTYRNYRGTTSVKSMYTQYWFGLMSYLQSVMSSTNYERFSDYFIDEYYVKQMANVGPLLYNYDYKLKYLTQFVGDKFESTTELTRLQGRKISYSRNWLNKHILFLDSVYHWRDSGQSLNYRNNVNSRASNIVYNTPEVFPMKTNNPLIMSVNIATQLQGWYFMQDNTKTYVNAANFKGNSAINWNFSNSPNVIELGDEEIPLSSMYVSTLGVTPSDYKLDVEGYPSITELNLANNSFRGSFNLEAFEKGAVSELRVLNFKNTKGASFNLNLVTYLEGGGTYTKYSKLQHIDISESTCVANITLPEIPLVSLALYKSSITNLDLISQKYLPDIDLSGCNKLLSINVQECHSFTGFDIDSLNNLQTVKILNCDGMEEIEIKNCPNLISVNIENCNALTKIVITNCPNLKGISADNYVTISECGALKTLDLSNNLELTTVRITESNQGNITTLNMHNTKIDHISGDGADENLLDLYKFTKLDYFSIYNNSAVTKIQFANTNGSYTNLRYTFRGCNNLERVFGNLKMFATSYNSEAGMFRGCTKFSIHGNSTTFKGSAISTGGVIKTPWEICSGVAGNRGGAYANVVLGDLWQGGKNVTNLVWNNQGGLLNYTFYGTSCSQFDFYYAMASLALSGVTAQQSISFGFYGLQAAIFNWSTGNQPDRYTFYKCSMITSLGDAITSHHTFIYSPTVDSSGKVTEDNGTFSPLTNLTSIGNGFSGGMSFSKNVFKRSSGNPSIQSISNQSIPWVIASESIEGFDTYTNYSNASWLAANANSIGDFTGFFEGLPNLTYVGGSFNSTYINYSTIKFGSSLVTIRNAFKAANGTGTIDLEEMFPSGSQLSEISNSFVVSNYIPALGGKVKFPISADTFKNITKLAILGFNDAVYNGGSATATSFYGNGLVKYFTSDSFPENLVSRLTGLKTFAGFFREVVGVSTDGGDTASNFSATPSIPGNMFTNNKLLENVASLMYNANFRFQLSGNGFANCSNLKNVSYFCYHTVTSTSRSQITGEVPNKLFYHGHQVVTNTIKGTRQETQPDGSFDLGTLETYQATFNKYNATITNAAYALAGCIGLSHYTGSQEVEANPDYSPFTWIYNESTNSWKAGDNAYEQEASWSYNGASAKTSGVKYLETITPTLVSSNVPSGKQETMYYCCSPDLLRYCTDTANIIGLFSDCGLSYSVTSNGNVTQSENVYSAGLTGRIPPYLLKPVANTASVRALFKNCKKLSSYSANAVIYQIPVDFFSYATKVSDLVEAFQGLSFIQGTTLDVFSGLTSALDIRKIFAMSLWSGSGTTISGIFRNNIFSKISGAFSYNDLNIDEATTNAFGVSYRQYYSISASDVNASNNFNNKVPASANVGYVYHSWGSRANDVNIANTNNNY